VLTFGVPVLITVLVWWLSTGIVLYVIGWHPGTFNASMIVMSVLSVLALAALGWSGANASVSGAYVAFLASLVLWGWHEMSFLTGYVTGPRTTPLPAGVSGSERLIPAIETVIYHELALFLTLVGLGVLLYGSANEVGLWTFAILWVMRLSAKLNVYLGVSNLTEGFLPDHLKYLKSYFRHRPMNFLFPVSVTGGSIALAMLVGAATDAGASDFARCGMTLLASLMALAVLEHWFLVVPIPAEGLWTWGLASRVHPDTDAEGELGGAGTRKSAAPSPAV
jgi:putative photosynthetic complex assembly protein 2